MSKGKDLTGQKFGKLTVLEKGAVKTNLKGHRYRLWICECECGKITETSAYALSNMQKRSCGCFHKTQLAERSWKGYEEIAGCYFSRLIRQARERDLEFCLTIEFIWDLYLKQDKKCALSGLPIIFIKKYSRECKLQTASLDRINSSKGYTEDNVQLVHKTINVMKGAMTTDEFYQFCKIIVNYLDRLGEVRCL